MTTINTTSNYSTTTTTFTPSPPPAAIVPLNSFPSNLPPELVLKIFEHLNSRDVVKSSQLVCKHWSHILPQDSAWEYLYERHFQLLAVPKGIKNFQEAYKKRDLLYSNLTKGVFASISIDQISQVSTRLISADGKIFSGHDDCQIRIWDSNTGKLISALEGGGAIYALAYAKGQLFSGDLNGVIKVWDSNTYKCTATFGAGQGGSVHALAYADGNKLVVASGDLSLKVLDLTTGEYTFLGKLYDQIIFLKYADGKLFSGDRSEFNVWDLKEGEYTPDTINMDSAVSFVYADGMVISGDIEQNIQFWDLATGNCTTIIPTKTDQTKDSGGCFLAYADGILFSYVANKIIAWNPKTKESIAILEQEPGKEQMRYVDMIYVDGKLSCYEECKPDQDYKKLITMDFMDFTASHTVILEEIARLFERRHPTTDLKAWSRLTKMPTSTIRKITGNAQGDPYINNEQSAHSTSEHWIQLIRNYVKKQREEERHPLLTILESSSVNTIQKS
jgi:WD40 repeat protein